MTISFEVAGVLQKNDGSREQISIPLVASFSTPEGPVTIDHFVRSILDRQDVRDVLRQNVSPDQSYDFWLSYSHPDGLWRCEEVGKGGQFTELRIGLKVLNSASPVRFASGKFRSVPFVSGTSTSGKPVQFVLAKNPDGSSSGYLIDNVGIRALSIKAVAE